MLDATNSLVKSYRMARDCFQKNPDAQVKLRLNGMRKEDGRTYNLPMVSEVAGLIIGDLNEKTDKRDIIVQTIDGKLKRVSELHPSYLALQYPLLLPYGDDGYRIDILHKNVPLPNESSSSNSKNKKDDRQKNVTLPDGSSSSNKKTKTKTKNMNV